MDLQMLLDEREIKRGLSRFSRILDIKSYDDVAQVFADDVAFNYGIGGEQVGLLKLRALFQQFLDHCGPTQHLIGSILVDIDGDTAVSRSYVQARHQRDDDPMGPVLDTNGEYIDQWERRSEGWRIVRRDSVWTVFTGDATILENLGGTILTKESVGEM